MALYIINNNTAGSLQTIGTVKTITSVYSKAAASGITLSRAFLYEFEVGTVGTPNATDNAISWDIMRATTTGTASTGVVNPLDPADTAASHDGFVNHTAEGTTTGNSQLWQLSANQRASYRWVVNPGGPGELVVPATASNGAILRGLGTTYALTANATIYFRE